ncbi:redoxin domain-containing protein [Catenovulum sp. 2E275]|uniref:redoxin domain-containing protein n=1 Tax=Catenovulum sp. 2E275 TaxID=2980497 RepID=UPI0021D05211|nr:redoxin domain-containing protein [Catenovulum sp. 2E275]MCU4676211.1 redoxin domain-containing protein [Catenovulum sp. 2E275]
MMNIFHKMNLKSLLYLSCLLLTVKSNAAEMDSDYLTESFSDIESFALSEQDTFPSVALTNSQGEKRNIRLLANKQNILLVVYRGEVFPFCIAQLKAYKAIFPELKDYNIKLVAISPDDQASIKNLQHEFGDEYVFLSDSEQTLVDMLGLKKEDNQTHPATILLGKGGEVLWYYADPDFKTRPSAEQIKQILNTYLKQAG